MPNNHDLAIVDEHVDREVWLEPTRSQLMDLIREDSFEGAVLVSSAISQTTRQLEPI
jgi:hypothetical protein